jgi:hypothetical protein
MDELTTMLNWDSPDSCLRIWNQTSDTPEVSKFAVRLLKIPSDNSYNAPEIKQSKM